MQHRTQVLTGSTKIAAVCSCGWKGPDRKQSGGAQRAREDAADHVLDELQLELPGTEVTRPKGPTKA